MAAAAVPSSTAAAFLFDFLGHFRVRRSGPIGNAEGASRARKCPARKVAVPACPEWLEPSALVEFPSTIDGVRLAKYLISLKSQTAFWAWQPKNEAVIQRTAVPNVSMGDPAQSSAACSYQSDSRIWPSLSLP
jgi:hypothetical protein